MYHRQQWKKWKSEKDDFIKKIKGYMKLKKWNKADLPGCNLWYVGGHSFCRCGWAPVRGFLFLFWCETHTKGLGARFLTWPEEDEEKQGPRAVNNDSQWKAMVRERRQLRWGVGWDLWIQKPDHTARDYESAFLVAVWEVRVNTRTR